MVDPYAIDFSEVKLTGRERKAASKRPRPRARTRRRQGKIDARRPAGSPPNFVRISAAELKMTTAKPSMVEQVLDLHRQHYGEAFAVVVQDEDLVPRVLAAPDRAAAEKDGREADDCAGLLDHRADALRAGARPHRGRAQADVRRRVGRVPHRSRQRRGSARDPLQAEQQAGAGISGRAGEDDPGALSAAGKRAQAGPHQAGAARAVAHVRMGRPDRLRPMENRGGDDPVSGASGLPGPA